MSVHEFLCMPSLDKATVREELHGLDTSILGRVVDRTTSSAPAVTKADHAAKRKASIGPEISTNAARKTKSSKKVSGTGSSGLAARDEIEHTDDGALDDGDQRDRSEFAMEDIENLNDVNQGVSEDASSPAQEAMPAPDTQPMDADVGADEIASNGNEEIHGVNLGLRKKELYKDPKVCRIALDRFPTPAETHRLRELSSTQTIKKQSADLKQQNESIVHANEEVSKLTAELGVLKSRCQMAEHKLSSWDKKHREYKNERDTLAMEKAKIVEELIGTKSQLEHRERQAEEIQDNIASFFQSDFTPLVRKFLKSSDFNRAFTSVLNTAISVGVECGLRMDRTGEKFRRFTQKVSGFIPDAKEKFDRVIVAFPNTTFPFLNNVS
nr:hypothetical protein [Tanacetum cinerariifolium]